MEGIIDKENERVRRFFALLDNMEKKWSVLPVTTVLPSTGNGS
ncbi:hypothetical protein SAMN05444001_107158 [Parabacteroides chinchillae]|uniref:Uncharacterized protein n=1 Tax=Parabacteroides chinchillae TaxID=871327 RepID=A0A8G2BW47_9BACT|nr:hypothetical protein SAMN05444001_107158 [Parabacteroides chinchillae]